MSTNSYYQPPAGKAWRFSLDGRTGVVTDLAPSARSARMEKDEAEKEIRFDLAPPPKKQGRESAFGYVDMPKGAIEATFAQCASCSHGVDDGRCLNFRASDRIVPSGACNLYQYGQQASASDVTDDCFAGGRPREAGYVVAAVRCANCTSFNPKKSRPHCELYERLNKDAPDYWKLEEGVAPTSCCNAWTGQKGARLSLPVVRMAGLHGGMAEGRPDSDFDADQLREGARVEMEHTDDPDVAKQIAKDHLSEDPEYYTKLAEMEKDVKDPAGGGPDEPGVYLFRHGKTKLNTDGESPDLIRGWLDVPLDEKGKEQAEELGPLGSEFGIKAVYCSDLKRTRATADAVAEDAGVDVEPTRALRPWHLGDFQGKSAKDAAPKLMHYATEAPDEKVPGGESFEDYCNRFLPFLRSVMARHEKAGENVALVTHYRNCKLTEAWVAGGCGTELDGDVFFSDDLPTGAVLRLFRKGGRWRCERVGGPATKMSVRVRFSDETKGTLPKQPRQRTLGAKPHSERRVADEAEGADVIPPLRMAEGEDSGDHEVHWHVHEGKPGFGVFRVPAGSGVRGPGKRREAVPEDLVKHFPHSEGDANGARAARESAEAHARHLNQVGPEDLRNPQPAKEDQASARYARTQDEASESEKPSRKVAENPTELQRKVAQQPREVEKAIRDVAAENPVVAKAVEAVEKHGGNPPESAREAIEQARPLLQAELTGQQPPPPPPEAPAAAGPGGEDPKRPKGKSFKAPEGGGQRTLPIFTHQSQVPGVRGERPAHEPLTMPDPEQKELPGMEEYPETGQAHVPTFHEMEAEAGTAESQRPAASPKYLHHHPVGSTVYVRLKNGQVLRGRVSNHFGDPLTPGSNTTEVIPTLGGDPVRLPSDTLASAAKEAGGPGEEVPAGHTIRTEGEDIEDQGPVGPPEGDVAAAGALGRAGRKEKPAAGKPRPSGPPRMELSPPEAVSHRHPEALARVHDLASKYGVGKDAQGKQYDRPLDDQARADLAEAMALPEGAKVTNVITADSPLEGKVPVGVGVEHGGKKYVYQLHGRQAHKLVEVGPGGPGKVHEAEALPGKDPEEYNAALPEKAAKNARQILGEAEAKADPKVKAEAEEARKKGERHLEGMARQKGWGHTLKVLGLILGGYMALHALRRHPGGLGLMLALAGLYFWAKKNADEKKDGKAAGSDEDAQKDAKGLAKGMAKEGDPEPDWEWESPYEQGPKVKAPEEPKTPRAYDVREGDPNKPAVRLPEVGDEDPLSHPAEGYAEPAAAPAAAVAPREAASGEVPPVRGAPYETPPRPAPEPARAPREGGHETPPQRVPASVVTEAEPNPPYEEAPATTEGMRRGAEELRELKEKRRRETREAARTPLKPVDWPPQKRRGPPPPPELLAETANPVDVGAPQAGSSSPLTPEQAQARLDEEIARQAAAGTPRPLVIGGKELPPGLHEIAAKYFKPEDLADIPDNAARRAFDRAVAAGRQAEAPLVFRAVYDYVSKHGTNRMTEHRRSRMSLDDLVALAWADFTGRGGTPSVANAERLSRDVARLSLAYAPDEVLSLVSGHVTRLSLGRS